MAFLILAFATSVSAISHQLPDFAGKGWLGEVPSNIAGVTVVAVVLPLKGYCCHDDGEDNHDQDKP